MRRGAEFHDIPPLRRLLSELILDVKVKRK